MEIFDHETAQAWLRQQDRKTITAFAARNSLRAMYAIGGVSTDRQQLPHFFVLRSTLTACVAATAATPVTANKLAHAAQHAAETLDAELKATSLMDPSARRSAGRIALNAVQVASEHKTSVERSAETAFTWADNFVTNTYAAANRDARLLTQIAENGQPASDVFNATLWPSPSEKDHAAAEPAGHVKAYERVIASMDKETAVWSFWQRWWEGMRTGDLLPWELQERVALIPSEIWEAGQWAVAEKIKEIEDAWRSQTSEDVEPEPVSPADVSFLFQRAPIVQASMSSMAETITLRLDAFSSLTRPNEKIAFVETLCSIPKTAQRISEVLEEGPNANNAITTLALEVGKLRAEVEQLKADLKAAQDTIEELRKKPWYKSSSVLVAGSVLPAIVAGVWALSGDDKTLEARWNKLAGDLAFLSSQVWPETEDRVFEELKLELPPKRGL